MGGTGEFSYACEKGFDVGSAVWVEVDSDKPAPLGLANLRLTHGYIILVPMPDFSMPFNVIVLTSTAVTFFFGSLFRLTAAGRAPHWVLKKDGVQSSRLQRLTRKALLALAAGFVGLAFVEP